MLEFLKKEANKTYTENGAVTNRSTGKACLDLFATIGALRRESDEEIAVHSDGHSESRVRQQIYPHSSGQLAPSAVGFSLGKYSVFC